MPKYDYWCSDCKNEVVKDRKITDESVEACEKCGKTMVRLVPQDTLINLTGSGWYKGGVQ